MPIAPELHEAKNDIADMVREQDPEFKELRGCGIGLHDTIMVMVKSLPPTIISVPDEHKGFKIKLIAVGDPQAL